MNKGIEKANNILMPLFGFMLIKKFEPYVENQNLDSDRELAIRFIALMWIKNVEAAMGRSIDKIKGNAVGSYISRKINDAEKFLRTSEEAKISGQLKIDLPDETEVEVNEGSNNSNTNQNIDPNLDYNSQNNLNPDISDNNMYMNNFDNNQNQIINNQSNNMNINEQQKFEAWD